ncbi:hypothetical protein D9615_003631 [Tricholomella constricta]|uniref:Transcription factor BYE1 n=1 Tax=Tricholomella constricta TaxID=117010 RepID=A0A8H5M7L3_9AGAR|nr:hypothetical protein D9615_003631 [Tricholomella constricta]
MSTRSRTRAAAASTSKAAPAAAANTGQKPKSSARKASKSVHSESDQPEKENVKGKSVKTPSKTPSGKKRSMPSAPVYCTCKTGDDGTPMVRCGECKIWYHFRCVNLKEEDAEDINIYICPSCVATSGRRTTTPVSSTQIVIVEKTCLFNFRFALSSSSSASSSTYDGELFLNRLLYASYFIHIALPSFLTWEGPDALEVDSDASAPASKKPTTKRIKRDSPAELPSESEEELSSEDEYIVEDPKAKVKRHTRRLSYSSDSDSEVSDDTKPRRHRIRKVSNSPAPSSLKRKIRRASHTPPPKRKKSDAMAPEDDATRKYCLGKLGELFRDIFLRYPHVRDPSQEGQTSVIQKSLDDLTEDERAALVEESKQFADELEKCIFEIYSETDKQGLPSAASKYKDRFRMLQFNLSKFDRVVIHQRIASAEITPKEISLMSSTDLANEETKQSIKIAEKEALEYSILTPTAIPRAKITHKGLEDIEDVHGEVTTLQDEERSRKEEEERRERERMARLRAQARQRTASLSVPPESPVVSQQPWGGPPPIPIHAMMSGEVVASSPPSTNASEPSPITPTTAQPIPDPSEPELNLADFINIDAEVPTAGGATSKPTSSSPPYRETVLPEGSTSLASLPAVQPSDNPPPISPTGISPFAPKSDQPRSTSFDLNALWNAPKKASPVTPPSPPPAPELPATASPPQVAIDDKDVIMDIEGAGADDQDFDMFLEEKESSATSPEAQQAALDALPQVWTGKINMPLDSTIPQETPVAARQVGGRPLEHDSALWKTLFPSELLRIDGRVPVENSSKFLLQMRMNASRELIAVAFTPASESSDTGFRILSDFLIAKGRHGLVFPWGHRPKDHHPGRELYIIPLLSSDPLPDYMELLDNLHLPKLRKANLLVGIWVLIKGKLAPPAAPPPIPTFLPVSQSVQHPVPNTHTPPYPPPSSSGASPLPANIASEVASLTPEQIQLMIQTLTANGTMPLPISQPQPQLPPPQVHAPPPPMMPLQPHVPYHSPPPPPPQSWANSPHGYGGIYPPPHNPPTQHNHPRPPPLSWDRPADAHPGTIYERDDRGGRGWRGGGRGTGRGRGRPNDAPQKPVDSGWPRRPRPDNGGPGPSSPTPRW